MPSRNHLDVQPSKKDINKLKKIAKLSKWQKDLLSYLKSKPVILKSAYKNYKPIAKWKWTMADIEKMLEAANGKRGVFMKTKNKLKPKNIDNDKRYELIATDLAEKMRNKLLQGDWADTPTNTLKVSSTSYTTWWEALTAHELVYASKVLSKQLDCHIQIDRIDRNRIVEFSAKKGCMSRSKTIRISVKKIKKAYTNKADYIDIRSISLNYPKTWSN